MDYESMRGNPWLRLLRREVEALARAGTATVMSATCRTRPSSRVNREIRRLQSELAELEKQ
jgi:hypothetical protein